MGVVKTTVFKSRRRRVRGQTQLFPHHFWGRLLIHRLQLAYDGVVAFCYVNEELIIVSEVEILYVKPNGGKAHLPSAHGEAELCCVGEENF